MTILWKIPLKYEMLLENATEQPLENATENPRRFLRCWFLVCNALPLESSGGDHAGHAPFPIPEESTRVRVRAPVFHENLLEACPVLGGISENLRKHPGIWGRTKSRNPVLQFPVTSVWKSTPFLQALALQSNGLNCSPVPWFHALKAHVPRVLILRRSVFCTDTGISGDCAGHAGHAPFPFPFPPPRHTQRCSLQWCPWSMHLQISSHAVIRDFPTICSLILKDGVLPRPCDDFCDNPCDNPCDQYSCHEKLSQILSGDFTEVCLSEIISFLTISTLREFAHDKYGFKQIKHDDNHNHVSFNKIDRDDSDDRCTFNLGVLIYVLSLEMARHMYTWLVSHSAPTWSTRCCFTACRF